MSQMQSQKEANPPTFNKGMTLEQYMNRLDLNYDKSETLQDEKQQNLYQSALLCQSQVQQPKGINYYISEIDQQSVNQSLDDKTAQFPNEDIKDQLTKETFREANEITSKRFVKKSREEKMRNTAYFNNISLEKKHFRVKNVSNSPARKKTENAMQFNGALTLYGHQFRFQKQKEDKKVQQLITFYGKVPKPDLKEASPKKQSKKHFKNKGHLELNQLLEYQSRIKNNFSQKIYLKDFRIEGMKDRLRDRKNKFC